MTRADNRVLNEAAGIVVSAESAIRPNLKKAGSPVIVKDIHMLVADAVRPVRRPSEATGVNPVVAVEPGIGSNPNKAERVLRDGIDRNDGTLPDGNADKTTGQGPAGHG